MARWISEHLPRRLLRHGKNGRRTCSNGSVSLSTYKLFEERSVWLRFAELSDRPISLVYRVPVTAPNQSRTHKFTLPRRKNSEYTAFRGGKELCSHPSTRGQRLPSRENTILPANVRRIYTPPAPLAGRGGALKLVRGDAAFLIMSLYLQPSPSNLQEKQLSEKIWTWARRVLDETTSRVVPVLLQQQKTHSTASAWENSCGTTICKRRTHTSQWERLSLDPSLILRSTSRVFRLLFMLADVVHCTTTEIDCNWQQPREKGSSPHSVCLSASAYIRNARKKARSPVGQEQAYTGCPLRAGLDHFSGTGRGSVPA